MTPPLDPSIVREFLETVGTKLDSLPDPYKTIDGGHAPANLLVRLLGKLGKLQEEESEITNRFVWEVGKLQQAAISSGLSNCTGFESGKRELRRNEIKERSEARENWFRELSEIEKTSFDIFCLKSAGRILDPILESFSPALHGALARLAFETVSIVRIYSAERARLEQKPGNASIKVSLFRRLNDDEDMAKARLAQRWFRELTPEQEAAFDGVAIAETTGQLGEPPSAEPDAKAGGDDAHQPPGNSRPETSVVQTAGTPAGGVAAATDGDGGSEAAGGMSWQEAAERLDRLRTQGEPWTSYDKLADQFGCSSFTIYKAVTKTPKLHTWAKRQSAPRAQHIDNIVRDETAQNREPDPMNDVADAELRKIFENADANERAFINSIKGAASDYQLWYIEQSEKDRKKHRKDYESHVESDPTVRIWFHELPLNEKLEWLNDPGRYQKTFPQA